MTDLEQKIDALVKLVEAMPKETNPIVRKLAEAVIDTLSCAAERLKSVDDELGELNSYAESIDDGLTDLELALFEDEEFDDADEDEDGDEDEDEDEDPILSGLEDIHYACPHCGHPLTFRAAEIDLEEDFLCPECGEPVFPELEDEDDD